jgi:hypothetical protein
VNEVQALLEKAVPICDDLSTMSSEGFTPHLTVGQWEKVIFLSSSTTSEQSGKSKK